MNNLQDDHYEMLTKRRNDLQARLYREPHLQSQIDAVDEELKVYDFSQFTVPKRPADGSAITLITSELNTLNNIDFGYERFPVKALGYLESLTAKGVITYHSDDNTYIAELTDLGKQALAQASANATEAGGEGAPVISAAQFVSDGYAAKIRLNECVVMFGDEEVIDAEEFHLNKKKVQLWYDTEHVFGMFCWADEPLQVEWLTPSASPAPETVAEGAGTEAQLRLDLETFDKLFCTVEPDSSDEEWKPFMAAQDKLFSDVDGNLHMLFDLIDAERTELAALRVELKAAREQQARLLAALTWIRDFTGNDEVYYRAKAALEAASALAAESGKGAGNDV